MCASVSWLRIDCVLVFFFKQKPAYEMRISDWSSDVCSSDLLWALAQQGPEAQLNQTEFTQPALLAAGVAVWRVWQAQGGPLPAQLAGHSLGEYAALVAAGALSLGDGARLVRERGRLMQHAVPAGLGAMAAVLGAEARLGAQGGTARAEEGPVGKEGVRPCR